MRASGGGTLLFALAAIAAPWTLGSALLGKWIGGRPTTPVLLAIAGAWLAVAALDWARRLAIG